MEKSNQTISGRSESFVLFNLVGTIVSRRFWTTQKTDSTVNCVFGFVNVKFQSFNRNLTESHHRSIIIKRNKKKKIANPVKSINVYYLLRVTYSISTTSTAENTEP